MSDKKIADTKVAAPAAVNARPIPEKLPEELLPLFDWWHGEGKKTVLLVVMAAVIVGLGVLYRHHLGAQARLSSEQLLAAKSVEELETLANGGNAGANALAKFRLAKSYYDAGRYDEALALYEALAKKQSHPFAATAILGKAHVLEAQDQPEEARTLFNDFRSQNPDHYLAPQAVIGEARCMATQGAKDGAMALLDVLIAAKADSQWEHIAENTRDIIARYEKREKRSLFDQADIFATELMPTAAEPPSVPAAEAPESDEPATDGAAENIVAPAPAPAAPADAAE